MTITREQVADLRPDDVVEFTSPDWPGATVRGPVREQYHGLFVGPIRLLDRKLPGTLVSWAAAAGAELRIISRAPRPLYVNHDRAEPVPGDVVRQLGGCPSAHTWHYLGDDDQARWWRFDDTRIPFDKGARLVLLVDGETGRAVQ